MNEKEKEQLEAWLLEIKNNAIEGIEMIGLSTEWNKDIENVDTILALIDSRVRRSRHE